MTPKEKAIRLVDLFIEITPVDYKPTDTIEETNKKATDDLKICKKYALIAANEIFDYIIFEQNSNVGKGEQRTESFDFWKQVIKEISNL